MLTIDIFFTDRDSYLLFKGSDLFEKERIGAVYRVDPASVDVYELEDLPAIKISFPRAIPSGDFGDRDITGGQEYAALVRTIIASRYGE